MLIQLSIGAALVILCAALHVIALDLINRRVLFIVDANTAPMPARLRIWLLICASLAIFLSHILQIWIWACFYLLVGEFEQLEPALYFSTVVFTTLGFCDVLSSPDWRLTASCEAAAGLFLISLSTAYLFEVLREILPRRRL